MRRRAIVYDWTGLRRRRASSPAEEPRWRADLRLPNVCRTAGTTDDDQYSSEPTYVWTSKRRRGMRERRLDELQLPERLQQSGRMCGVRAVEKVTPDTPGIRRGDTGECRL